VARLFPDGAAPGKLTRTAVDAYENAAVDFA
jgi:hypothetical protein